ncbi:hypothetical protein DTO013E5_5803 [Penicillium roqueforti]|nr:hypothetical protein DTO012A1_7458 [Penicillium roqueforti]KAI2738407.1 hypothetical protein DTO013F2_9614 [Penicillium roqueforti]KAI2772581.1 hypothetical protein DTO012A8_2932 [Penicillium roqueforti]KAI3208201.1 hypothetical protein DTO013E5_5803 [Penicillium roqueforti]KAI3226219.1 hypothetical protein DTO012A9_9380 [Penicillium roqueforti]
MPNPASRRKGRADYLDQNNPVKQYTICALNSGASDDSVNGPMAYLRSAAKKQEQDPCDKLRNWLPKAEFSAKDDAPHMRLCRNVPADLLQPFQKQVRISRY